MSLAKSGTCAEVRADLGEEPVRQLLLVAQGFWAVGDDDDDGDDDEEEEEENDDDEVDRLRQEIGDDCGGVVGGEGVEAGGNGIVLLVRLKRGAPVA